MNGVQWFITVLVGEGLAAMVASLWVAAKYGRKS